MRLQKPLPLVAAVNDSLQTDALIASHRKIKLPTERSEEWRCSRRPGFDIRPVHVRFVVTKWHGDSL
jgi:hypothetical protein